MSETTEETTETTEPQTNAEQNLVRQREQLDALKAENAELRSYRDREVLRQAGFDPDSGEGKSLARDLATGAVKAEEGQQLSEVIAGYAENEYGWKPRVALTAAEETQAQGASRLGQLSQTTSSQDPPNIDQQIAEAEQAGNHRLARQLKNQVLQAQMAEAAGRR